MRTLLCAVMDARARARACTVRDSAALRIPGVPSRTRASVGAMP
ncbi:hypothetical protein [Massilia sp. Se16.2.3]|nr:hypothetical protein [Massilia sp. Se16.2.3]